MTRQQWQALARTFLDDAQALLAASRWGMAYYAAGYAVECGLKACIVKRVEADPGLIFATFAKNVRTHDFDELASHALLKDEREAEKKASLAFRKNWELVDEWTEDSRYDREDEVMARGLLAAITDPNDGVLPWIEKRWN